MLRSLLCSVASAVALTMASSFARMSDSVRAKCYALRNAASKQNAKPMPYWRIAELVTKNDDEPPSEEAVRQAVLSFGQATALLRNFA